MSSWISDFGVVQYNGLGEGRDEKYDSSAKPSDGTFNHIEVVVNENGPVPNVGTGYGNGQACVPAGALIKEAVLLVEEAGSAASVTLSLVKQDGTDPVALLAATTPSGDGVAITCAGAAIGKIYGEDRYVKVGGTTTGLKAKLVLTHM